MCVNGIFFGLHSVFWTQRLLLRGDLHKSLILGGTWLGGGRAGGLLDQPLRVVAGDKLRTTLRIPSMV
jgi:hypothetical protein